MFSLKSICFNSAYSFTWRRRKKPSIVYWKRDVCLPACLMFVCFYTLFFKCTGSFFFLKNFAFAHPLLKSHYERKIFTVFVLHLFWFFCFVFLSVKINARYDVKCLVFFRFVMCMIIFFLLGRRFFFSQFINVGCYFCFTFEINIKIVLWRPFVYWKRYSRAHVNAPRLKWNKQGTNKEKNNNNNTRVTLRGCTVQGNN